MATYTETLRSNYFQVKNNDAFTTEMKTFSGVKVVHEEGKGFCLLFEDGFPSWREVENDIGDVEEEEIDNFPAIVATHLCDEHVIIFQGVGSEAMRYVNGYSIAINSKGEEKWITLDDIYELARSMGKHVTECSY